MSITEWAQIWLFLLVFLAFFYFTFEEIFKWKDDLYSIKTATKYILNPLQSQAKIDLFKAQHLFLSSFEHQ